MVKNIVSAWAANSHQQLYDERKRINFGDLNHFCHKISSFLSWICLGVISRPTSTEIGMAKKYSRSHGWGFFVVIINIEPTDSNNKALAT